MTRIALWAGVFAIALAGAACSSKNKKQETTPAKQTASQDVAEPEPEIEEQPVDEEPEPEPELGDVIYFEFDSADLLGTARSTLEQNAEWLEADAKRTLTIEGHTDEVGTPEYNLGLGERRARAAKDYLVRLGIDAKRISIITYGEEKPASPEDEKNRRSVFVATKNKK